MLQRPSRWRGLFGARDRLDGVPPGSADPIRELETRLASAVAVFERAAAASAAELARLRGDLEALQARLRPPELGDTLEMQAPSLAAVARERLAVAPDVDLAALPAATRYALFESVFYESHLVAAKQRIYTRYLDDARASGLPFLDLGCGRGEFLRLLRETGIPAVGVDANPVPLEALRAEGFEVVAGDLVQHLEAERRRFSGIALLQVAEHLAPHRLERVLALAAQRLAPGGVLIVETPNPLSPFVLGVFHTDPTHVAPVPPDRLRYAVEAAGFEDARLLFQARVPDFVVAGPDPRAYYADYAVIARRAATPPR